MNLQEMLTHLNLPTENPSDQDLEILKQWCRENVSCDVTYTGDLSYEYKHYGQLATQFQNFILTQPINTTLITQEMSDLGQINCIQYAAKEGYHRYIEKLMINAAAINQASTASNMTALHLAARFGHLHTVMVLLEKGADPTLMDKNNDFPIMHCFMYPLKSQDKSVREQIFYLLNDKTPNLYTSYTNNAGNSLFHALARKGFTALLDDALNINPDGASCINLDENQPINLAIRNAHETKDVQALLLNQKPSIAAIRNKQGDYLLHDAASYVQDESLIGAYISAHIQAELSLNVINDREYTALMLAAKAKNRNMIVALIQRGADPTYKNKLGENILNCAYQTPEDKAWCEWIIQQAPELDNHQISVLISQNEKLTF